MGKRGKQKKQNQKQNNAKSNKQLDLFPIEEHNIDELSKDIKVNEFTLDVPGKVLMKDTTLTVAHERKYGIIGENGSGKSTLLRAIYDPSDIRIKVPNSIDMYFVEQEIDVSDTENVFEMVLKSNSRRTYVKNQIQKLDDKLDNELSDEDIVIVTNQIDKLETEWLSNDWDKDPSIIKRILVGLGFSSDDQKKETSKFSGGWRMRISLARALYIKPALLLLDEPTNHLDLDATIWLTNYLEKEWKNTLMIISHNIDFIDTICTDIIHLHNQKLDYYKGNYNGFKNMFTQKLRAEEKEWNKVEKEVKNLRKKSAPRKKVEELLEKKAKDGIVKPNKPYSVSIEFDKQNNLKGNLIELQNVSFSYKDKEIFRNIDLGIDTGTRIAIIGANGVGKSTLIKIISGDIEVDFDGEKNNIVKNPRVRIGYFNQHSKDTLPEDFTPVEYLSDLAMKYYPDEDPMKIVRRHLGTIGLPSDVHKNKMSTFSGGQKARVVLVSLQIISPHILLLDEPTNHLDIETIEALIKGINAFKGAVIVVSHDSTLINGVDDMITLEVRDYNIHRIEYEDYVEDILKQKELDEDMTMYQLSTKHKKIDTITIVKESPCN